MTDRIELEKSIGELGETAVKLGLNPPHVNFEVVPSEVMYEMAAYHLPDRFPHWTHGREYHRMKSSYNYGLSKIYELVINTDPPRAYLMETNKLIEQKLVIAHVLGHVDFFNRNVFFKDSNRQMDTTAKAHADLIRRLEQEQGLEAVEKTLDSVLSIALHVDPTASFFRQKGWEEYEEERLHPKQDAISEYDDIWSLTGKRPPRSKEERKIPPEPQRDLLGFLAKYSRRLEDWQRDVLYVVREEWNYYYPNMRTRVINEGYATFWHEKILENVMITADELLDFRRSHTGIISSGHRFTINPYAVGYRIWRDIEKRWEEPEEEKSWYGDPIHRVGGQGIEKVFEVASRCRDSEFIRGFLTEKLVEDLDLYAYQFEGDPSKKEGKWVVQQEGWEKIRDKLANQLTSLGVPAILVEDGDYHHQGELLLSHDFQSDREPLDTDYTERTLRHIFRLWGRPVNLKTRLDDKDIVLTCADGDIVST